MSEVVLGGAPLIETGDLRPGCGLPLLIRPRDGAPELISWAVGARDWIEERLAERGGLLFRGFSLDQAAGLEQFITSTAGAPLPYQDRATPRRQVHGNIYTSTEYPRTQRIFLHNESSFAATFPLRIVFLCVTPAREGGETPIADVRKVFQQIPRAVRDRFIEKGVLYVRNFGGGFGLPWQEAFGTSDKAILENLCVSSGITTEWVGEDRLRTRQRRPAVARHPRTGELVWFNHAAVLHVSTLEPSLRDAMLEEFRPEDLPNNTYYGDGTPIDPEALEGIRGAYREESVFFRWQEGDVLLLDNMLVAHGREPFAGPRKIVVGMARPVCWSELPPVYPDGAGEAGRAVSSPAVSRPS